MTECKDKLDQYIKEEKLGEGTYGVVYKCKDKETYINVKIKKQVIMLLLKRLD